MDEETKYQLAWSFTEYRKGLTPAEQVYGSRSLQLWMETPQDFPIGFESALDIGCGRGLLLARLNELGVDAWGIDIAENALDPSIQDKWGHKFVHGYIEDMAWKRRFDLGICTDVMEHIPPDQVFGALRRIAECCDEVLFKIAHTRCEWRGLEFHLTVRSPQWWVEQMCAVSGTAERLAPAGTGGISDGRRSIRWRP